MSKAADQDLIDVLRGRDGLPTGVELKGGQRLNVFNIAWGYDIGDEYAHVTTNCSPFIDGAPIDFFSTDQVVHIFDPASRTVIYRWPDA